VIPLPPVLSALKVGRGHKAKFSNEVLAEFRRFAAKQKTGLHAPPLDWPEDDKSWRTAGCGPSLRS
jgi:hypothetical protein